MCVEQRESQLGGGGRAEPEELTAFAPAMGLRIHGLTSMLETVLWRFLRSSRLLAICGQGERHESG
jgi:hypothetical protein